MNDALMTCDQSLVTQTIRNALALLISQYSGLAINFCFSLWLTSLLSPKDFGFIAASLFFFRLADCVTELGWEEAFLSCKELPFERAASTHLWIRTTLGSVPLLIVLCLHSVLCALVPAGTFLVFVILGLSWWLEKIALTYESVMVRSNLLHNLARVEFILGGVGSVLAIYCALQGYGLYALAIHRLVSKGLLAIGYLIVSPWKGGIAFDIEILRTYLRTYGFAGWLAQIAYLPEVELLPFIVSVLCGVDAAGMYEKSVSLGTFPTMLSEVTTRLTVPLYTRSQGAQEELKNIFVSTQTLKALVLFPGQLILIAMAPWWIAHLLGPQWLIMVPIYRVMAAYSLCRSFYEDVPQLFTYGLKNPWEKTRLDLAQACALFLFAPLCTWQWGLMGAGTIMLTMACGGVIVLWRRVMVQTACKLQDFFLSFQWIPSLFGQIRAYLLKT